MCSRYNDSFHFVRIAYVILKKGKKNKMFFPVFLSQILYIFLFFPIWMHSRFIVGNGCVHTLQTHTIHQFYYVPTNTNNLNIGSIAHMQRDILTYVIFFLFSIFFHLYLFSLYCVYGAGRCMTNLAAVVATVTANIIYFFLFYHWS